MAGSIRVRGDRFNKWGYFFVAPFVLAFIIFQVYPICYTIFLGFTDLKGNSPEYKMVGTNNFLSSALKVQLAGYTEEESTAVSDAINDQAASDGYANIGASVEQAEDGATWQVIVANLQQPDMADLKTVFEEVSAQSGESFTITLTGYDQAASNDLVVKIKDSLGMSMYASNYEPSAVVADNGYNVVIEGLDQSAYDEYKGILDTAGVPEQKVVDATTKAEHNIKLDPAALTQVQTQYSGLLVDDFFWKAFKNTWIIWFFNFAPQLIIAMLVAIWFTDVSMNIRGSGFFKAMFYLPNLLTAASVAVLFATLFTHPSGPVNQMLVQSGISPDAINFYRSDTWTRGIVSFIQWWTWYGSTIIVLVAGITGIPTSLYESAVVDGANSRQMFFKITLPLLRPVMIYTLITSVIGGMQMFDIPYLLTNRRGDPNGSIMTTSIYMYMQGFTSSRNLSYAAAVSIGLFLLTLLLCLALFFLMRDKDAVAARKMRRLTA